MITKWYLPLWSKIKTEDRISFSYFLIRIDHADIFVIYSDGRSHPYTTIAYMARLLEWERSEKDAALRKLTAMTEKFITVSKELSAYKKGKI